ncbi:SDR family oxidoreductase, partial [Actinophytocola sp.]|uniref:SDR family oxidoreductase n=1 Tax=Actinophytocola sp. TaxID=1872138 RepID=UPI003899F6EE
MATYLVTGATGLIGRHFVAEILARPDTERVWVLVRERSQERLAEVARNWPDADRVRNLVGDIRAERLGISDDQVAELVGGVDHLVHLAALYDIAADDDASIAANVEGTRHVLALAEALRVGCLDHVSSVAVAGDYRGRFTEEMFDAG